MLAIIGFGNHVQKNILPALNRLNYKPKYIVVRNIEALSDSEYINSFTVDLESVLKDKTISTIYIATPISTHFYLCKLSLEAKKNVICEKPLVPETSNLEILHEIANKNNVTINQVVMYKYHKLFDSLEILIDSKQFGNLISFITKFEIPHLNDSDIRYKSELGGGALLDVGFYPISLTTTLFGEMSLMTSEVIYKDGYNVDLEGKATFLKDNLTGECYWAIGKKYSNFLELTFEKAIVSIDRFYSKPHDLDLILDVKHSDTTHERLIIGSDDQFLNMFVSLLINGKGISSNINETRSIISNIEAINDI
ncbi:Gfo/Idh/MocA family protein [Vibrio cyclitrophicus]